MYVLFKIGKLSMFSTEGYNRFVPWKSKFDLPAMKKYKDETSDFSRNSSGNCGKFNGFHVLFHQILFHFICWHGVYGRLNVVPENIAVTKGEEVIMRCSTDSSHRLNWLMLDPSSGRRIIVFDGYEFKPAYRSMFRVQQDGHGGQFDLVIDTSWPVATQYTCLEPGSSAEESAALIIVESDPYCAIVSVSSDDGVQKVACTIGFSGNWVPRLKWKIDNDETSLEEETTTDISKRSVTNTLRLTSNRQATYTCSVFFEQTDKPDSISAANEPHLNGSCSATVEYKGRGWNLPTLIGSILVIIGGICSISAIVVEKVRRRRMNSLREQNTMALESSAPTVNGNQSEDVALVDKTIQL